MILSFVAQIPDDVIMFLIPSRSEKQVYLNHLWYKKKSYEWSLRWVHVNFVRNDLAVLEKVLIAVMMNDRFWANIFSMKLTKLEGRWFTGALYRFVPVTNKFSMCVLHMYCVFISNVFDHRCQESFRLHRVNWTIYADKFLHSDRERYDEQVLQWTGSWIFYFFTWYSIIFELCLFSHTFTREWSNVGKLLLCRSYCGNSALIQKAIARLQTTTLNSPSSEIKRKYFSARDRTKFSTLSENLRRLKKVFTEVLEWKIKECKKYQCKYTGWGLSKLWDCQCGNW